MAGCKITKKDGGYTYEAGGHFNCTLNRLHDAADVTDGKLITGLSTFHPGGGTEYGHNNVESIYYILEGELLFRDENNEETLLKQGDSVHIAAGANKSIMNTGDQDSRMLVFLLPRD